MKNIHQSTFKNLDQQGVIIIVRDSFDSPWFIAAVKWPIPKQNHFKVSVLVSLVSKSKKFRWQREFYDSTIQSANQITLLWAISTVAFENAPNYWSWCRELLLEKRLGSCLTSMIWQVLDLAALQNEETIQCNNCCPCVMIVLTF